MNENSYYAYEFFQWQAQTVVNLLLQSTFLILAGLTAAFILRGYGSAIQSAIYRATLGALLICPFAAIAIGQLGISGWTVKVPAINKTTLVELPYSEIAKNDSVISANPSSRSIGENDLPVGSGSWAVPDEDEFDSIASHESGQTLAIEGIPISPVESDIQSPSHETSETEHVAATTSQVRLVEQRHRNMPALLGFVRKLTG